jgi:RNA-binding protein 5/10
LLEIFTQYAQVKDIRMIRDRITAELKDFAFVEYFTVEEAEIAMDAIRRTPIRIRNYPLFVTFSKIRRPDELKVFSY